MPHFAVTQILGGLYCTDGDNVVREPHFVPAQNNPPAVTFYDPDTTVFGHDLVDRCGALTFNGRTRSFNLTYATQNSSETPWKYWWRRSRRADSGTTRVLDEVRKVRRGVDTLDDATILMPLDSRDDALAAVLLISSDSTYVITDSAFLDPEWYALDHENLFVQHWRTVPAPTLNSLVKTDSLEPTLVATLQWTNGVARAIDSTIVFRNYVEISRLGPGVASYTDTVPSTGIYSYGLQHFTWRLFFHPTSAPGAIPASAWSNVKSVTFNYPPHASFTVSCQQLPCTFTDASTDSDGSIVSWLWTFGDGDSSTQQNPSHTYDQGGDYSVHLTVTDDLNGSDDTTIVAHPLEIAIGGPTTVKPKVTCEWDALPQGGSGGMTYSWRIGGQEVGTDEFLYWYTGTFGFQITLIGAAGDGQVDTAAVTVTLNKNAPSCVLKRG